MEYDKSKLRLSVAISGLRREVTSDNINHTAIVNACDLLCRALNDMDPKHRCLDVILNDSSDKQFFGVVVYPEITFGSAKTLKSIIFNDEDERHNKWNTYIKYSLELDYRLFMVPDVSTSEIEAIIKSEIDGIVNFNMDTIREIMEYIDPRVSEKAEKFYNNKDLFKLVLGITMRNCTSIFCAPYSLVSSGRLKSDDPRLETIALYMGANQTNNDPSYPGMLFQWYLNIFDKPDMATYLYGTLTKAFKYESSKLYKRELKKAANNATIKVDLFGIKNKTDDLLNESALKKKRGLIAQMKLNGLRSIEEDLYEYNMRLRNVETQDEAILLMRQLNSRMSIIEDYLFDADNNLDERDRARWEKVYNGYVEIRDALSKKTVYNKKMYGLFVDYNALQQMNDGGAFMNTY